ncbi:CATRA system-associated protein [Dactylosporangium sp. CA-139066]|uniref:CATRA system-associated protein n=1 Tax=Dactylosporangium sp. CA-139066 TaxID=3239930 RepID=UPI003D93F016
MTRLLLVQDEPRGAPALAGRLRDEGFSVEVTAGRLVAGIGPRPADLLLLDLPLPGVAGAELCRDLRTRSAAGIIVLGAARAEPDATLALDCGADDYLPKPYGLRELVARIRAVLRRRGGPVAGPAQRLLDGGRIQLDTAAHTATLEGRPIELSLKEFQLLETLLRRPGHTVARDQLVRALWGEAGGSNALSVHIKRLRARIEPDPAVPRHIVTVRGVGYKYLAWPPAHDDPAGAVPPDLDGTLRAALGWHLPPSGWMLVDALAREIARALDDGPGGVPLAGQRLGLLEPGRAIPAGAPAAQPCPPDVRERLLALIEAVAPSGTT